MERLANHRPQKPWDRTYNCSSVEKRDCSTVSKKKTNDAHTREPWLPNDVMSILTTDHASPGAPTLGQSVSKIISQISRVTSDPVPSNRSMEITTSVEFASKSDHFHVDLRLPTLLFPLLWMSSSNDGARRGLYNASSHGLEH